MSVSGWSYPPGVTGNEPEIVGFDGNECEECDGTGYDEDGNECEHCDGEGVVDPYSFDEQEPDEDDLIAYRYGR